MPAINLRDIHLTAPGLRYHLVYPSLVQFPTNYIRIRERNWLWQPVTPGKQTASTAKQVAILVGSLTGLLAGN